MTRTWRADEKKEVRLHEHVSFFKAVLHQASEFAHDTSMNLLGKRIYPLYLCEQKYCYHMMCRREARDTWFCHDSLYSTCLLAQNKKTKKSYDEPRVARDITNISHFFTAVLKHTSELPYLTPHAQTWENEYLFSIFLSKKYCWLMMDRHFARDIITGPHIMKNFAFSSE